MHLVSGFWDKAVEEELRNRLAASYVGSFSSEGEWITRVNKDPRACRKKTMQNSSSERKQRSRRNGKRFVPDE